MTVPVVRVPYVVDLESEGVLQVVARLLIIEPGARITDKRVRQSSSDEHRKRIKGTTRLQVRPSRTGELLARWLLTAA